MTGRKHVITTLVFSLTLVVAATTAGTAFALPTTESKWYLNNGPEGQFYTDNLPFPPGRPTDEDRDGNQAGCSDSNCDWAILSGFPSHTSTTGGANGTNFVNPDILSSGRNPSGDVPLALWPAQGMNTATGFTWFARMEVRTEPLDGNHGSVSIQSYPSDATGYFNLEIGADHQGVEGIGDLGPSGPGPTGNGINTANNSFPNAHFFHVAYVPGEGYWLWRNNELLNNYLPTPGPMNPPTTSLPVVRDALEIGPALTRNGGDEFDYRGQTIFDIMGVIPGAYLPLGCIGDANCDTLGPVSPPDNDFTWNAASGDWNVAGNWTGQGAPPGKGEFQSNHTATFADSIGSDTRTVFTDEAVTLNSISFDNTIGGSYVIAGGASINLWVSTEEPATLPSISVAQGSHRFQAPVSILSDTSVDVASNSVLIFDGALDLMGNTLTKTGAGEMAIRNDLLTGGGTVDIQQGTLSGSGTVGGDVNNGGAVSPGNSAGVLTIDGDYNQGSGGTLAIEIAGTSPGDEHDRLVVNGQANLAGALAVTLIDSFTPLDGHTFDILDFSSVSGDFDSFNLPGGFDWNWDVNTGVLSVGSVVGGLAGDYDGNGVVDAADYTIYMDNLGGDSAVLGGNGSGASTVGQADYLLWKNSFGNTSGSGSSAAIPEPAALLLALLALAAAPVRVRCG